MIRYRARLLLQLIITAGTLLIMNMSYVISFVIRFKGHLPSENFSPYLLLAPYMTIAALFFVLIYNMQSVARKDRSEIISAVFCIVSLTSLTAVTLSYFSGKFAFPRTVFMVSWVIQNVLLLFWYKVMKPFEQTFHGEKNIVVVGGIEECLKYAEKFNNDSSGLFKVNSIITNETDQSVVNDLKVMGTFKSFRKNLPVFGDSIFLICSQLEFDSKFEIIHFCMQNNITVLVAPDFYDIVISNCNVTSISDTMLFRIDTLEIDVKYQFIKRVMDILISTIMLAIIAIPSIIVAILIKIDSRGPVFYCQERVSQNGSVFKLFKFRTMISDAEKASGPILATSNDSRITRVGKFLRATRIDELPQFINVLMGDMSIVGPRPERPFFVEKYIESIPSYAFRSHVKSGITGLAQVEGKYSTSVEDKLKYDLLYAKTYSPVNDLRILFHTLKVVLMKDKAC